MAGNDPYIRFTQRSGLEPIPEQLKLGEVSAELRRLLDYSIYSEIERGTVSGHPERHFRETWRRVSRDLHVLFLERSIATYRGKVGELLTTLRRNTQLAPFGELFNLIEFLVRHPDCSGVFKEQLANAFVRARSAYRIIDEQIVAIGTEEQGEAVFSAIEAAEAAGAGAARTHLISAGAELRAENWSGSVRESIHAVAAMALKLSPDVKDLGPALTALEKSGHLHRGLRSAFASLYGYTSDEKGVRHALVFDDKAKVDETDALFMLGACASFVSYLISRSSTA